MSHHETSTFEEIEPPVDVKRLKLKRILKVVFISAGIIIALFISIPIIFKPKYTVNDSEAVISGFDRIEKGDNFQTFQIDLAVSNPSATPYKVIQTSLNLYVMNTTFNSLLSPTWTLIRQDMNIGSIFSISPHTSNDVSIPITITQNDSLGLQFLSMSLFKYNYTIRIAGDLMLSISDPSRIHIDTKINASELFNYTKIDDSTGFMLENNDLIAIPGESPDNMTNIEFVTKYINPFNFNITMNSLNFSITNGSTRIWSSYALNHSVNLEANGYANFTATTEPQEKEITSVLSYLINGTQDVFNYENISATFSIGNLNITGFKGNEGVNSDYNFSVAITGFKFGTNSLTLDLQFQNPCGIVFNVSYIYIDIYITNTNQVQDAIWLHSNVSIDALNYVPVKPYSNTTLSNIPVNFNLNYANKVLIDRNPVDYIGYLTAQSFQYFDNVPFIAENRTMLS